MESRLKGHGHATRAEPTSALICALNTPADILSLKTSRGRRGRREHGLGWGTMCRTPKLTLSWQLQALGFFFLLSILGNKNHVSSCE